MRKEEWKVYRQRLRDITSVEGFENCSLNNNFEIQGLTYLKNQINYLYTKPAIPEDTINTL